MNIQGKLAARKAAQDLTKEIEQATSAAITPEIKAVNTERTKAAIQGLGQSGLKQVSLSEKMEKANQDSSVVVSPEKIPQNGVVGHLEGSVGTSNENVGPDSTKMSEGPLVSNTEQEWLTESASNTTLGEKATMSAEMDQNGLRSDFGGSEDYSRGGVDWKVGKASETFALPGQEQMVQSGAEQELGRDEAELLQAQNFVGEESPDQVQERLAEDREDFEQELKVETGRAKLTANQERLTDEAVKHIEQVVAETADCPGELERAWFLGMMKFIKNSYDRDFGDRN